jgi:hypothetical protein
MTNQQVPSYSIPLGELRPEGERRASHRQIKNAPMEAPTTLLAGPGNACRHSFLFLPKYHIYRDFKKE